MLDSAAAAWSRRRRRPIAKWIAVAASVALIFLIAAKLDKVIDVPEIPSRNSASWAVLALGEKVQRDRLQRIRNFCLNESREKSHRKKKNKDLMTLITDADVNNNNNNNSKTATLLYCHVPKAASSSWMRVVAALSGMSEKNLEELVKKDQLHKALLEGQHGLNQSEAAHFEADLVFTFVRHPFSRLASAYHDKFVTRREESFYAPLVHFKRTSSISGIIANAVDNGQRQEVGISFTDFVDFVLHEINSGQRSYGSLHWIPASQLCDPCLRSSESPEHGYNFIGKLETLQSDVEFLAMNYPKLRPHLSVFEQKWNANQEKSQRGSGKKKKSLAQRYLAQLDPARLASLERAFRRDFLMFGYQSRDLGDDV